MEKIHALTHRLSNPDLGILLLRIALGIVFINAGLIKITHADFVIESFATIGISATVSYIVMYAELIGGILLILGFWARRASIVLAVIMLVALFKVHFAQGFSLANGGYEYVLVLFLVLLAVILLGAGKYSVAQLLKKS